MSEQGITQEDERWIEERRLAALEQRVGELVEITRGCVDESIEEQDALARLAALRAPGVASTEAHQWRMAHEASESALATARRERDEALGVVRDLVAFVDATSAGQYVPDGLVLRARALVAGQPVADPRDAEIERLRAKLAEAERCAQESADIMRRARDRAESYCLRLGEAESQRDALRQHALKLDGLCERALAFMGKAYASWDLAIALRARGEVPR